MRYGHGAQFGRVTVGVAPSPSPSPTPAPSPGTLIDTTTGVANFSAAPWSINSLTMGTAGVAGPGGTGVATLLTSTGAYDLLYRTSLGTRMIRARVKAGTTDTFTLYIDTTGGFTTANFNLTAGTIGSALGGAAMTSLGNGWWSVEAEGVCTGNLGCGPEVNGTVGVDVLLFDFSLYSVP